MKTPANLQMPGDLKRKIFFTLGIMAVYRAGVAVPTPGVDGSAVLAFFQAQSGGIFGLFNTFTGGALERFSVFALGIMPYISASIIFQLLQPVVPYLDSLKKEGEHGRRKISQYTRYATVLLAVVQGYAMSSWLMGESTTDGRDLVVVRNFGGMFLSFRLVTVLTLTAGAMVVMWLGEQITERGVGNGASLIIFAGIAAGMPGGLASLWGMVGSGDMRAFVAMLVILGMVLVIGAIVFVEVGQRRVPIQYSMRGMGQQAAMQQGSHLPLKVNYAGVIPPIFASSLLMFPATMTQFVDAPWMMNLQNMLMPTGSIYNVIFVSLVVFFCFFYTEIVFNAEEVADNLKKRGGFVPGIRAGSQTAQYLRKVLDRLTVSGAVYLSAVCIMPNLLRDHLALPFYFGGTSLLILVGVALDTSQQIQSHMLSARYSSSLKNVKIRRRVRF